MQALAYKGEADRQTVPGSKLQRLVNKPQLLQSSLLQLSTTIPASHKPCLFTVKSAAQFAKTLKQCDECYCFMLSFTHCVAHSGDKVAKVYQHCDQMLIKLEKEYLAVFSSLYIIYGSKDNHSRYL